MKEVLAPLAQVPGLQKALVIGDDGLLIQSLVCPGADLERETRQHDASCALVLGWAEELAGRLGQLSWEQPQRFVLRGSRSSLVVCRCPHSWLAAWIEPGALAEDLRVPMGAALGRIARLLRGPDLEVERDPVRAESPTLEASDSACEPPSPLPASQPPVHPTAHTSTKPVRPMEGRADQHPLKEDA